jgi:CubicO group peptidase (beta-lactamase class C family)
VSDDQPARAAAEAAARRSVGATVGVLVGNRASVHGAGRLAVDAEAPTGDSVFQIGSITKVVTALLLADAVTRGEVTLETPLTDVVPEAPSGLPLGSLATQSSGLPRLPAGFRTVARRNPSDPYRDYGPDDVLAALGEARLKGVGRYRYSNFGFGVLGLALARVAGRPYDDLVAERVAAPLGLRDTVVMLRPDQLPRKAAGHSWRRRAVPDWHLGGMEGAGALWSSADDLLVLLRAHLFPGTTPLEPALRLVQEPRLRVTGRLELGLAWHISPVERTGRSAVWHNGGTGGFRSFAALVPERSAAVVVLSNSTRSVDRLALRLLKRLATGQRGTPD